MAAHPACRRPSWPHGHARPPLRLTRTPCRIDACLIAARSDPPQRRIPVTQSSLPAPAAPNPCAGTLPFGRVHHEHSASSLQTLRHARAAVAARPASARHPVPGSRHRAPGPAGRASTSPIGRIAPGTAHPEHPGQRRRDLPRTDRCTRRHHHQRSHLARRRLQQSGPSGQQRQRPLGARLHRKQLRHAALRRRAPVRRPRRQLSLPRLGRRTDRSPPGPGLRHRR